MKSIDIKIVAQRMHTKGKSFVDISEALHITRRKTSMQLSIQNDKKETRSKGKNHRIQIISGSWRDSKY